MNMKRHPLIRFTAMLAGLAMAAILTGCGGGGDSTGGNGPVQISSDSRGTVEGMVRLNDVSMGIGALAVKATAADSTVKECPVELNAYDDQGNEHLLAITVTDQKGFYRFLNGL